MVTSAAHVTAHLRQAMTAVELLIRGLICGVIIAAPVGPVNVLCMQRTIEKGWRSGVVSGLGSAMADTIYGAIAGFSISFVIAFLIREEFWIRLFGGFILIGIGILYYFRKPQKLEKTPEKTEHSDIASTFLLTLTNPTTVLSFLAVLAALGLAQRRSWGLTLFVVLGIFAGSMVWWIVLSTIVNRLRHKFNDRTLLWMNRIGGLAIGAFGVITLLLAHSTPR
jgi:threonine/homoserine/homoserine lactone efflux protein